MTKKLFLLLFIVLVPVFSFIIGVMVTVGFGTRYFQPVNKPQLYSPESLRGVIERLSQREVVIGDELVIFGKNFGEKMGTVGMYTRLTVGTPTRPDCTPPEFSRNIEILSWKDKEIRIPEVPETDHGYVLNLFKFHEPSPVEDISNEMIDWAGDLGLVI